MKELSQEQIVDIQGILNIAIEQCNSEAEKLEVIHYLLDPEAYPLTKLSIEAQESVKDIVVTQKMFDYKSTWLKNSIFIKKIKIKLLKK